MHLFGISDSSLRLGVMLGLLAGLMLAEARWPRRVRQASRRLRWRTNFSMVALGSGVIRVMGAFSVPLVAVAAAEWGQARGIGLLNLVALPPAVAVLAAILLLDLAIWAQHLATHRLPLLWRLHSVHHADRDIDTSTALRFHPLEIALSMLFKTALVLTLGAAPVAVLIFEILLNATALFNHTNVRLPASFEHALRTVLVTPDLHRIHHSVMVAEQNTNFGTSLTLWDRLFGTYRAAPAIDQTRMAIGLDEHQNDAPSGLFWSLRLPVRSR